MHDVLVAAGAPVVHDVAAGCHVGGDRSTEIAGEVRTALAAVAHAEGADVAHDPTCIT